MAGMVVLYNGLRLRSCDDWFQQCATARTWVQIWLHVRDDKNRGAATRDAKNDGAGVRDDRRRWCSGEAELRCSCGKVLVLILTTIGVEDCGRTTMVPLLLI
ncbi:hypothetical protein SESBI_44520 [Sesbania bispinosa]|nr:hypothetical protein SESBI_44520 [Sesbania bispinosa]